MATNPFVTSTAVRTRQLFFGRQDEIKQLYAAISAAPGCRRARWQAPSGWST